MGNRCAGDLENITGGFPKLSVTENTLVCGFCRNRRRASDIVYVDADSGVAVFSDCAARISVNLVEWEKEGLEKIDEPLKKHRKSAE